MSRDETASDLVVMLVSHSYGSRRLCLQMRLDLREESKSAEVGMGGGVEGKPTLSH